MTNLHNLRQMSRSLVKLLMVFVMFGMVFTPYMYLTNQVALANTGLTIHFKKPASWGTPQLFYYDAQPAGVPAVQWNTAPQMTSEGNDWFVYTIPGATSATVMFKDANGNQIPGPNQPGFTRTQESWYDGTTWHLSNPDIDTAAPTAPTNLDAAQVTHNGLRLTWTAATDNKAVTGYEVRANGTKLADATGTSYSATALTPATEYKFRVVAKDAAGNVSAESNEVTINTKASYVRTITLDGVNDFNASASGSENETFSTSGTSQFSYVTWDDDNIYFGYLSDDITSTTTNAASKWIQVYVGGQNGTKTGVLYTGQQPTLPFDAKFHLRFKVDGTYTNIQTWNGTAWTDSKTYAQAPFSRNNANKFIEFRIPRADLGLTNANSMQWVSSLMFEATQVNSGAVWASVPSDSFGAAKGGFDLNFETYYEFDLKSLSASAAQVYNYEFKNTTGTSTTASFSFRESTGATGVAIQQSTDGGATWTSATTESTLSAISTTATVTGLTTGTSYKFRLMVLGGSRPGSSTIENVTLTDTPPADTSAPTAPTNLASSNVTQTGVTLSWTASTDNIGVTGYEVWQNSQKIADVTATTYNVTGLTANTAYTFKVRARDAAGNFSATTADLSVTTAADSTPPPTGAHTHTITMDGVNDFYSNSDGSKNETFSTSGTNQFSYVTWDETNIYFGYSSDDITTTTTNAASKWIQVYVGGQNGTKTGVLYTGQQPTLPFDAKFHLRFKVDGTYTNIQTWNGTAWTDSKTYSQAPFSRNNANKFIEFRIPRADLGLTNANSMQWVSSLMFEATQANSGAVWASVPSDSFGVAKGGFDLNFATFYEFDLTSTSGPASQVYTYEFANTASTPTTASFSFKASSGATGVAIQQSTDGGATWTSATTESTLSAISTTATVTGLTEGTSNKFRLVVQGGANAGSSTIQNVTQPTTPPADTTAPTVPTNLASSNVTQTGVTLSWTASTDNLGVTGYEVWQNNQKIADVEVTTYNVTGLTANTAYTFKVRARDAAGNFSATTADLSVTTAADSTPPPTGTHTHTITMDGVNDFYSNSDGAKNETFSTSSTGMFSYVTWDATNIFFGYSSDDITTTTTNAASKWIQVYVGGQNGTKTGVLYTGQQPTLPFDAKFHLRFKVDGTYTNIQTWNGTAWTDSKTYAQAPFSRNNANKFIEFRIPRADLGLTNANSMQWVSSLMFEATQVNSGAVWASVPSDSFGAAKGGFDLNFATFYEFDLTSTSGPATQVYNYEFANPASTPTTASFSFKASSGATGVSVQQSTDGGATWTAATTESSLTASSTSAKVIGLSSGTNYKFRLVVQGGANEGSSTIAHVAIVPDTTPPTTPTNLASSNVAQTELTLSWTASTDNVELSGYEVWQNNTKLADVTGTTYNITGLTPGTTYLFKVRARDIAGNFSETTPELSVTTGTEPDTQAPTVPTNLTSSNLTMTGLTLSWTASTDNVGVTGYEIWQDNVKLADVTGTTYNITGLTVNTTYAFKVRARDAAGLFSEATAELAVTTPDTQAPTAPTNFTFANVTMTGVTLSWTASTDNVGVTGYEVWQNNVKIADSSGTTYNVTGLTASTSYAFKVRAKDAAGNFSPVTSDLNVTTPDTEVPTVPTNPVSSNVTMTGLTLSWTASTDNVGVTGYEVWQNGVKIADVAGTSYNVTGLTAGTAYTFNMRARDAAGNFSPATADLNVSTTDTQVPTTPANLTFTNLAPTSVTLNWTASTDNVGVIGYEVWRDSIKIADVTGTTYNATGLTANTSYTFNLRAKDAAGNLSAVSANLVVATPTVLDTQEPTTPTNLTSSNLTMTGVTLSWTASTDNVGVTGYEVWQNNLKIADVSGTTYNVTGLTVNTAYAFKVRAKDAAGNFSSATADLSVTTPDTQAPTTPANLTSSNLTMTGLTLTWTASTDNVGVTGYEVWQNNVKIADANGTSYNVTGLTAGTAYAFKVRARDAAGNFSQTTADLNVTTPDTQAPTMPTNLASSNVSMTSLTLTWTASTDNVGVTGYEVWQNNVKIADVNGTTYNVTGLTASTAYVFKVRARDAAGNFSPATGDVSVTTPDTQAPTNPTNLASSNVTNTGLKLTWTASTDNVGVTGYEVWQNSLKIADTTNTSFDVIGLSPSTVYTFKVRARDAAGNFSGASFDLLVETFPNPDTEAPSTPFGLVSSDETDNSFTVSWSSATDNVAVVGYEVYLDGVLVSMVSEPTATFSGLKDGVSYAVKVRAVDAQWNISAPSDTLIVGTLDSTKPTVPEGLIVSQITASGFKLSWNPSTDQVTVIGYQVYRDGSLIATVGETSYTFTGLTDNTSYSVTVSAVDLAGNVSDASQIATAKTLDGTAPSKPTGLTSSAISNNRFTVNWTVASDNVGVTGYEVYLNNSLRATVNVTTFTFTGLVDFVNYSVTVRARDARGNLSPLSDSVQVRTTDGRAPSAPQNLVAGNFTANSLRLTWTASTDNVAVTGYEIYRGNTLISTVGATVTAFSVTGLLPGTSYTFSVRARDAARNVSAASSVLRTQTRSTMDVVGKTISINGKLLNLGAGIEPVTINGSIMVPFRAIFEALGLSVSFNATTKTIEGSRSGYRIRLQLGSRTALVNGTVSKTMPVAPAVINGTTMVPLRFIAEELGLIVTYRSR